MNRGDGFFQLERPATNSSAAQNKSIFNHSAKNSKVMLPVIQSQFSDFRKGSIPQLEEIMNQIPSFLSTKAGEYLENKRGRKQRNLTTFSTKSSDMTSSIDYSKLNENFNKSNFHKMKRSQEGFRKSSSMTNQLSQISAALNTSAKTV